MKTTSKSKSSTTTTTTTTSKPPATTTTTPKVEEKKASTTTKSSQTENTTIPAPSSTTIQQSSGPSKKGKRTTEPKPEKIKEPKPEKVKEPKPEKVKIPKSASIEEIGTHFGVKAGINNTFFLGGSQFGFSGAVGSPDYVMGFQGGLVANYGFNETFALQAEALYIQQSTRISNGADNSTFKSSGIEIPLALQLKFGENTKLFVNAGGYANYVLASSISEVTSGKTTIIDSDYTGTSFGSRTDYGAIIGFGAKFKQILFIEARVNYSFKEGTYRDATNQKITPLFTTLSIGYLF